MGEPGATSQSDATNTHLWVAGSKGTDAHVGSPYKLEPRHLSRLQSLPQTGRSGHESSGRIQVPGCAMTDLSWRLEVVGSQVGGWRLVVRNTSCGRYREYSFPSKPTRLAQAVAMSAPGRLPAEHWRGELHTRRSMKIIVEDPTWKTGGDVQPASPIRDPSEHVLPDEGGWDVAEELYRSTRSAGPT